MKEALSIIGWWVGFRLITIAVMQFVQVDDSGRPEPLEEEPDDQPIIVEPPWSGLQERTRKLLRVRL